MPPERAAAGSAAEETEGAAAGTAAKVAPTVKVTGASGAASAATSSSVPATAPCTAANSGLTHPLPPAAAAAGGGSPSFPVAAPAVALNPDLLPNPRAQFVTALKVALGPIFSEHRLSTASSAKVWPVEVRRCSHVPAAPQDQQQLLEQLLHVADVLLQEAQHLGLKCCANPGCANLSGESEAGLRTKVCTGCRKVCYCSTECQLEHWGQHEMWCRRVRRALRQSQGLHQEQRVVPR